jgi:rfaE bifunctional protein kinase chain/domain
MNSERFGAITGRYNELKVAVFGDFCLDRYLEIDPSKQEVSLEPGLPVHCVVNVRPQPGAAGTILNNLVALRIGAIYPVGFAGQDGEGFELMEALKRAPGVLLSHFIQTEQRRTFTYCKPMVMEPGKLPVELNRLDLKNWTPTPALLRGLLRDKLESVAQFVDAIIILDQVEVPESGVVTRDLMATLVEIVKSDPDLLVLADSRRGLKDFPAVTFKMNAAELASLTGGKAGANLEEVKHVASELARERGRKIFVTLAERGILGAAPGGEIQHLPALPVRGPIDIVGAGDSVTANLTAALAAGAGLREALELANAAGSVVIHKLGTTGTATVPELEKLAVGL